MQIRDLITQLEKIDQDSEPVLQIGTAFYPIVLAETISVVQSGDSYVLAEEIGGIEAEQKSVAVMVCGRLED